MMQARAIDVAALEKTAEDLRGEGATAIFVAIDGKPSGVLAIADPIKATTAEAIRALRDAGIRVVMLTGDNRTTAEAVARKLGIADVEAEVLPEDKGKIVERLRTRGADRRHGGRRRERRAGARRRRCRDRDGNGNRCRDSKRRRHAA